MNKEIKDKWVAALRSGKYRQSTGGLRNNMDGDKFCCLGVLCDLKDSEAWESPTITGYDYVYDGHRGFISDDIRLWAGLLNDSVTYLADVNDNGSSFNEIADYIEKEL